jgi:hypothetical protein
MWTKFHRITSNLIVGNFNYFIPLVLERKGTHNTAHLILFRSSLNSHKVNHKMELSTDLIEIIILFDSILHVQNNNGMPNLVLLQCICATRP